MTQRSTISLLLFLAAACGEKKADDKPKDAPAAPAEQAVTVAGIVSLDTVVGGAEVLVFKALAEAKTEELAAKATSDAAGAFSVSLPAGTVALESDMLITMSRSFAQDGKKTVLWSHATDLTASVTSNLNVLASIAYEIAILEADFSKIPEAAQKVASAFGVDPALEKLAPDDPVLVRAAAAITAEAAAAALTVMTYHKLLAADLQDGSLDGKREAEPLAAEVVGSYERLVAALLAD
jgi:hypothetical protein